MLFFFQKINDDDNDNAAAADDDDYGRRVNKEHRLPSGLTLGAVIADDCAMPVTALARALQFLPVNKDDRCRPLCYHGNSSSSNTLRNRRVHSLSPLDFFNVVGVIGAETSPSSVFVANLLSMFAIPQASVVQGCAPRSRMC